MRNGEKRRLHWVSDLGSPTKAGTYAIDGLGAVKISGADVKAATDLGGRAIFTATCWSPLSGEPVWLLGEVEAEE